MGKWLDGLNKFDMGGTASFVLRFTDQQGNFLSLENEDLGNLGISITATKSLTGSPIVLSNMTLNPPNNGSSEQILAFSVELPGKYLLSIKRDEDSLPGSPYFFEYLNGDVDGTQSKLFGDGLYDSFAGNISIFYIQLYDKHDNPTGSSEFYPEISITMVESSESPEMSIHYNADKVGLYEVSYTATSSGNYSIIVKWGGITLGQGTAIYKNVLPGPLYLPNTVVSESGIEGGQAGHFLRFIVYSYDYYNNTYQGKLNISLQISQQIIFSYNLTLNVGITSVTYNITQSQSDPYLLNILTWSNNEEVSIPGSPFKVLIVPGPLSLSDCTGTWADDTSNFDVGSTANFVITQRDEFGNVVEMENTFLKSYFIARIYQEGYSLPLTMRNLEITPLGTQKSKQQRVTFNVTQPGKFLLQIGNSSTNILGSPFSFSYFAGILDLKRSIIVGKGLVNSTAGAISQFFTQARDKYGNAVETFSSLISVTVKSNTSEVKTNVTSVVGYLGLSYVSYQAILAGEYFIYVSFLQSSSNQKFIFQKFVLPGPVDMGLSKVGGFGLTSLATKNISNDVVVLFKDSYGNPTTADVRFLTMIIYTNFDADVQNFIFNGVNAYVAAYTPKSEGLYSVVISYRNINFTGIPYTVSITSGEENLIPRAVDIDVQPKENLTAGQKAFIYITPKNFTPSSYLDFRVHVDPNPWKASIDVKAKRTNNVTYLATLIITLSGSYKLYVSLFENLIETDPQVLAIQPSEVKISSCIAIGYGLTRAIAGSTQQIMIQTRDMFGNLASSSSENGQTLDFVMIISKNSTNEEFYFFQSSKFYYKGNYTINDPGEYSLYITAAGASVNGSPFALLVSEGLWTQPTLSTSSDLLVALENVPLSFKSIQGLMMQYSIPNSNVSLEVIVKYGVLTTSDMSGTFSHQWISKNDSKNIFMEGTVELLNQALQDITYIGDPGEDQLNISIFDNKGMGDNLTLPIFVRAINHPPFILAPSFINISMDTISNKTQGNWNVQIENVIVGDPDEFDRQAYDEVLQLSIIVQVDIGWLSITIPGPVIVTVSTRQYESTNWNPTPQIVPSNTSLQFTIQGIKFRASITDCNDALATLQYGINASESMQSGFIAHITIAVDDLGNYGCFNDCSTAVVVPLFAIADIVVENQGLATSHNLRVGVIIGVITSTGLVVVLALGISVWFGLQKRIPEQGKIQKTSEDICMGFLSPFKEEYDSEEDTQKCTLFACFLPEKEPDDHDVVEDSAPWIDDQAIPEDDMEQQKTISQNDFQRESSELLAANSQLATQPMLELGESDEVVEEDEIVPSVLQQQDLVDDPYATPPQPSPGNVLLLEGETYSSLWAMFKEEDQSSSDESVSLEEDAVPPHDDEYGASTDKSISFQTIDTDVERTMQRLSREISLQGEEADNAIGKASVQNLGGWSSSDESEDEIADPIMQLIDEMLDSISGDVRSLADEPKDDIPVMDSSQHGETNFITNADPNRREEDVISADDPEEDLLDKIDDIAVMDSSQLEETNPITHGNPNRMEEAIISANDPEEEFLDKMDLRIFVQLPESVVLQGGEQDIDALEDERLVLSSLQMTEDGCLVAVLATESMDQLASSEVSGDEDTDKR